VSAIFQHAESSSATPIALHPVVAANEGARLLDNIHTFIFRFVAFPEPEQADAVALWVMHSHAFEAAEATPRLSIQSAEKQSGKTRLLELLDLLARSPFQVASISSAAMFRIIAGGPTTLLIDEADSIFDRRGSGAEDVRGLLNAGYRRGGAVMRASGKWGVTRFDVFAPVALAGIGRLPDTVQDRSIVLRLKRRGSGESVEKLRRREVEAEVFGLRTSIGRWVEDNLGALAQLPPVVPDVLGDRAADIWEPLLGIACLAGGDWPERAASAAIKLSVPAEDDDSGSDGVRLLADVRSAFGLLGRDRVSSADLVRVLNEIEGAPWGEQGIDPHVLARMLRPFEVKPRLVRVGEAVFRGYLKSDFVDSFDRYLPTASEA
jgi:hypothetical protein